MCNVYEGTFTCLDYLKAVTTLLQRIRSTDPTAGFYEAADFQWWWRIPRPVTDSMPQLFWFDQSGLPVAAIPITQWKDKATFDPLFMPDASADLQREVIKRGLQLASSHGFDTLSIEVDRSDETLQALLLKYGFVLEEGEVVETWLEAENRPEISPLPSGYRLDSSADPGSRPHHMIGRSGAEVEKRLLQTSLYRPELDLVIHDTRDQVAAYGLFWFDPTTHTGLVEPMRTEDNHQRRGLARHILTTGIHLLAEAGAKRIKICFDPDNPPARNLYLSVGFEPHRSTVLYLRQTRQN